MPGGAVRPREKKDIDRESGTGIRTCDGTNNLRYMSISLGVDPYNISTVIQHSESESSFYSLEATPEPLRDSTSSQNSSRESPYHTAYSPGVVLANALKELELDFEQDGSKAVANTRIFMPKLPDDLLQPVDRDGDWAVQGDIEFHQVVNDQLNATKSDITRLSNELSVHKRSAAIWRADIRTDIRSTKTEQANSATYLHDLLSKITERVAKLEKLATEAGYGRKDSPANSYIQPWNGSHGQLGHGNGESLNTGNTPNGTISEIQQQIAALQCVDRDFDLKLIKIQQSLASTQGCFEERLLEMEKDINYLKRKHVVDTLDIDILKRQLATQKNINTILIDKISSMEQQMGHSGLQTSQLHALNNRLDLRSEE